MWTVYRPDTHTLDDLHPRVPQVALVYAVEAGNVRVTGFLESGPVDLASRRDDAEIFRLVDHVHHMGTIPHDLLRERKGHAGERRCVVSVVNEEIIDTGGIRRNRYAYDKMPAMYYKQEGFMQR